MARHTPGPYEIYAEHGEAVVIYTTAATLEGDDVAIICDRTHDGNNDDAQQLANAHLFAAAPDLLAACEAIIAEVTDQVAFDRQVGEARRLARAAIARARGK